MEKLYELFGCQYNRNPFNLRLKQYFGAISFALHQGIQEHGNVWFQYSAMTVDCYFMFHTYGIHDIVS